MSAPAYNAACDKRPPHTAACVANRTSGARCACECLNFCPPEWQGHWREWHRGHKCGLDPDEPMAPCECPGCLLLAALRELVRAWDGSTIPPGRDERIEMALHDADLAIAKAEGRQ